MRCIENGNVPLLAYRVKKAKDLGANGDIQHRNRLVSHQQIRLQDECASNHYPLSLSAGELGRTALPKVLGGGQTTGLEGKSHPFLPLLRGGRQAMDFERLRHDVEHRLLGIQRFVGVLEDHLRPLAQDHDPPPPAEARQVRTSICCLLPRLGLQRRPASECPFGDVTPFEKHTPARG